MKEKKEKTAKTKKDEKKQATGKGGLMAVVRVRGSKAMRGRTNNTLKLLNLMRRNHCVVVFENVSSTGMLQQAKDYITWGPVSKEVLDLLLRKKGRVAGDKPLDDAYVAANSQFKTIGELASALLEGKVKLNGAVKGMKPVFRLESPKGASERIKKPYPRGALGNRREAINVFLNRMI